MLTIINQSINHEIVFNFSIGEKPCMVDFMIWPWFERIAVISTVAPETDITHDRFPHLTKWMTRMQQIPAVKNTYVQPEHHIHFFATLREGSPDYDHGILQSNM
jgi:glutathione S-transferase